MQKCFVLRHGEEDEATKLLSERGKQDARGLAKSVRSLIKNSDTVVVLSSSVPRAAESARIIVEELGLDSNQLELHELLADQGCLKPSEVLDLIRSKEGGVDVVIVIGHVGHPEHLPPLVGRRMCNPPASFDYVGVPKGSGWVIDLQARTCKRVWPEP